MTRQKTAFLRLICAIATMMIVHAPAYSQDKRVTFPKSEPSNEDEKKQPTAAQLQDDRMRMEFEIRYFIANSKLSARVSENINGSAASIRGSLDMDSENSLDARLKWSITQNNKLRLDYMQLSTSGETANLAVQLPGTGSIFGANFDITSLATTKLDVKQARIGYSWQGIKLGNKVRLGPLVEARGFLLDGSIAERSQPGTTPIGSLESASGELGLGMLTIGADISVIPHRRVQIDSVISAIPVAGLGRVLDADTVVKFVIQKHITLLTGYKYLRLRVDNGPNLAELRMQGPVVGVGFRF